MDTACITLKLTFILTFGNMYYYGDTCTWPEYFDLPRNGILSLGGSRLWQTDTKVIVPEHGGQINGYDKSRTLIYIESNSTFQRSEQATDLTITMTYRCVKAFNYQLFLIATYDRWNPLTNVTYRCINFEQKNKFVLFWRWGPGHKRELDCRTESGKVSDWPLIYWPLRKNSDRYQVFKFRESMTEYPSCPKLGGFLMKVFDKSGSEIENCPNNYPSPRFDMECSAGEGLQLTPTNPLCLNYDYSGDPGAKMFCIANWIDEKYMFSLLVPAHGISVNSFQCLRLNKNDPTSEPGIIFLDTICKSGRPNNETENFLVLHLRKKQVENICDDTSDQCDTKSTDCSILSHWSTCMKTCNMCPVKHRTLPTANKVRGKWIVQKFSNQSVILIDQYELTFPGLGKFRVFSDKPDKDCIKYTSLFQGSQAYVLAQIPGNGCSPRVMQFNMKRVSDSVAILHISGTSVIRNNDYILSPDKWCFNNAIEAKWLYKVYQPYWPYTADSLSSYDTGWYTMVKDQREVPVQCEIWSYFAHINMQIQFEFPDGYSFGCQGEAHLIDKNTWSLSYNSCSNGEPAKEILFTCLSHYELSGDYYAATLAAQQPLSQKLLEDRYFCLLWPTLKYMKVYPMILHVAGECDFQFVFESIIATRKPLATITKTDDYKIASEGEKVMFNMKIHFLCLLFYVIYKLAFFRVVQ